MIANMRQNLRRLARAGRYMRPVLRHGTLRKLYNAAFVETELYQRKSVLKGRPYYFLIDICNVCNLRCPLCPTGFESLGRYQGMMSISEYRTILDKVEPYAMVASLYNHGEPFLNKDVFDIINYTASHNIATNISSNFNWPIRFDPKDIIRSGLEYLTISLDGASPETYSQYRVRGDFKEVVENVKAVLAARKELKSKTPFIEWQFIVFKHNEHEMARARELAAEWGVDLLRFTSPGVPPELMHDRTISQQWMPENREFWRLNPSIVDEKGFLFDRPCYYLYRSMSIYPGGGVSPCCFVHDKKDDFGNILKSSVEEIWNNERYRSARMLFSKRPLSDPRVSVICDVCPIFKQDNKRLCGASAHKDVLSLISSFHVESAANVVGPKDCLTPNDSFASGDPSRSSLATPVTLSIVIANYNGRELLAGCLDSIYRNPPTRPFEVIVVDDASGDGSYEMVKACFPQVYLIRNEVNVHYGRSNNRAFDFVQGQFVYLLNNDTVMLPGALDVMMDFLDENPKVGAVGSKLLNGDGTIQASVKTLPCVMSGLFGARSIITKLFPGNRFSRQHLLHLSQDMTKPFTAGYVSSASIMILKEVVRQVGPLDERLSYHIDADYCHRIWDAGWEVYYLPSATIIHDAHKGGTMVSLKRRFQSIVEFHRGSYIYFCKYQRKSLWHPMHLLVIIGLGARFVVSLLCQFSQEVCGLRRIGPAGYSGVQPAARREERAPKESPFNPERYRGGA